MQETNWIPGLVSSHVPRSNEACVPEPLSLCSRDWEPWLRKPACPRAHVSHQEKPLQWEVHAPQMESSPPLAATREKACAATKTQHSQHQINTIIYIKKGTGKAECLAYLHRVEDQNIGIQMLRALLSPSWLAGLCFELSRGFLLDNPSALGSG